MEMSNSRISCTWNGARRSSYKVLWVTKRDYAFEANTKRQNFNSRSWGAPIKFEKRVLKYQKTISENLANK